MALSVIVHRRHRRPLLVDSDGGGNRGCAARRCRRRRRRRRLAPSSPVGVTLAVGVPLLLLDDLIVLVSDNLLQVRPQKAVLLQEAAPDDAAAEEEEREDCDGAHEEGVQGRPGGEGRGRGGGGGGGGGGVGWQETGFVLFEEGGDVEAGAHARQYNDGVDQDREGYLKLLIYDLNQLLHLFGIFGHLHFRFEFRHNNSTIKLEKSLRKVTYST